MFPILRDSLNGRSWSKRVSEVSVKACSSRRWRSLRVSTVADRARRTTAQRSRANCCRGGGKYKGHKLTSAFVYLPSVSGYCLTDAGAKELFMKYYDSNALSIVIYYNCFDLP